MAQAENNGGTSTDTCFAVNGYPILGCTGGSPYTVDFGFHLWANTNKPPSGTGSAKSACATRQNTNGNTIENPSYYWDPIACTTLQPFVCRACRPRRRQRAAAVRVRHVLRHGDGQGTASDYVPNAIVGQPIAVKRPAGISSPDVPVRFEDFEHASEACRWWPYPSAEVMTNAVASPGNAIAWFMDTEQAGTSPYITQIGSGGPSGLDSHQPDRVGILGTGFHVFTLARRRRSPTQATSSRRSTRAWSRSRFSLWRAATATPTPCITCTTATTTG